MSKNISNLSGRIGLKNNLFQKLSDRSLNSKNGDGIKEIAEDAKFLKERRKYVVVIIFAVAAILTPPDPITQFGLGIPLLLLYELSILSVSIIESKNLKREREEENA